jgi:hypothetical protein
MLSGEGYQPGGFEGTIFWDGLKVASFSIPVGGTFNRVFTLPAEAPVAKHTLSVCASFNGECFVGEFARKGTTSFTITSEAQPPLVVSPGSGSSGSTVTLTGHSFMPGGYTGSILWDNQSVETFTIPYGGAFSMAFQIPINTTVDEHTITVCRGVPCYTDDLMQGQTVTFGVTDLLPVELVAFDAVADGEAITLSWETASETNNAGFEVEQLEAAAAWTAVAFVEGQGTTEAATAYTHRLDGLAPGAYTFRLKQIDFDGTFTYGPEVQAVIEVGGVYRLSARIRQSNFYCTLGQVAGRSEGSPPNG